MIIPKTTKNETLEKLNKLLKNYLIKTFFIFGYNNKEKKRNSIRSDRAKMILETINFIKQDKEIEEKNLKELSDMYKTYHYIKKGK